MLAVKKLANTTVSLDFADCPEDGGKYQLFCDAHGYILQGNNKNDLWKWAVTPADWCGACAGTDKRFDTYTGRFSE
jgi:hypothetical protein